MWTIIPLSFSSHTSPSSPSSTSGPPDEDNTEALVNHYLNLGPDLTELYEQWSSADTNFKKKAPRFAGVRILKQDAWEALMEKLCLHYGPLIGHLDSKPYHDMPSPSALTRPGVEAHLRQLGFGYRAKYLYQTALLVTQDHEPGWLDSLRNPESPVIGAKIADAGKMLPGGREGYRTAHAELLTLQGVGPKVADCVCLMGLGWGEAVPVDTHVWQIAQRDYKFGKGKHSSLTKDTYDAVGNKFRSLWGKEAGWSHSVLFTADLRAFSDRLTAKTETVKVKAEVDSEEKAVKETVQRTADVLKPVSVKREFEGEESTLNVYESSTKKSVKRRRKG
ncbi:uncharacterized protein KY384_008468 [Bacidia gigantensis]|uniref:uncharacterized protein n=1 Tax=Bacidia gigantensis TaxID=2732470 RepID=UPI001D042102|nr:uncharacterized protein KY384_008468 [Bacidia gigantensis]KAG8527039.1 hypothetical protein KY384_008468 [Bacidia gigantensis]